jgi:hypothetical protein
MIVKHVPGLFALTLGLAVAASSGSWSQEPAKPKDEALDSLLEKLAEPADATGSQAAKSEKAGATASRSTDPAEAKQGARQAESKTSRSQDQSRPGSQSTSTSDKTPKGSDPKRAGSAEVAPKDQELDDLLQKLGETKDTPAPDERPGGRPSSGEDQQPRDPSRAGKADRAKLGGKDQEIDQRLEELTGRKKKRPSSDQERSGPVGQIIKEMRDVEQRLGKPDTGDDTQKREKQIVKQIETLIEEVRRSGSSSGMRLTLRRVRRPGNQQGQQQGTTGALARGAPLVKPARPPARHSSAGGKDAWGHLPAELRLEIENMFKEMALTSKEELIDRYFFSVGKGKLVREE